MEQGTVAIGGVVLLPLIVGLIEFLKRFVPAAPGNVWLAASFVLGVAGQILVFLIGHGGTCAGWNLETWALAVVMGLATGLATGKLYDEGASRGWL